MGSADRLGGQENKSIWRSGWFNAALAVAALGVVSGSGELAAFGALIAGVVWASSTGRSNQR